MSILFKPLTVLVICALSAVSLNLSAKMVPVDLRCEGIANPLAASAEPNLSWQLEATKGARGQIQSDWQILVASSPELLKQNKGDFWNSGKTPAQRSLNVKYAGKTLNAGQACYWKVRAWDMDGQVSDWSDVTSWEVALTGPADWKGAQWIDDGKDHPTKDEDFYKPDPAPLMRETFSLEKPIAKARLHVAGLGLCYPSINGERLTDQVFDPQWTNFEKRILYRTHDVTELLQQGANCLGLELGNGWYNPLPMRMWGRRNLRNDLALVGRPRAIANLVIEYTDGSQTNIKTGPEWKTTEGPTIRNNIYLGEVHDAREAVPGWNTADFDDSAWKPVRIRDYPLEPLQALSAPPVRLGEPFPVKEITTPESGVYIVDFGRNFTGLPEIDLNVPKDTEITFRFGELLNDDGSLNVMTSVCGQIKRKELEDGTIQYVGGPGAPEIAWQEDVYIAKGGGETYRPNFTFHGFHYMEIVGLPEAPELEDFRGMTIRSDLQTRGRFSSSNEVLNQIQQVTLNTFLANVVTVQSDCPHRERFGYGGDIVATSEAFLMNFDMAGFYSKTVRDWSDAALPDGRLTDTAPFVGIDYCGVGWAMVHPLLLEQLHQHYDARDLIEENLPAALRWMDAEAARRENLLVVKGLGDHEALGEKAWGPAMTTPKFVHSALRVARLAEIVGRAEDAKRMRNYAKESSAAWEAKFLDPESGKVADGTQSNQTFALGFGDTSTRSQDRIFDYLVQNLTAPEDSPRLTTGIYGTRILLEELSKRGRSDLAYGLATRETFPSWAWMLKNGATTLWETWEGGEGRMSMNHPMLGSISAWFYRWLGGIQPAEDAVGFDRFHIRPQVVGDLEWVKTSYDSVRGTIVSNWSTSAAGTEYEMVIPPNTFALVELPLPGGSKVSEGGIALNQAEGIKVLPPQSMDTVRMKVGSGSYQFRVEQQ